MSRSRKKTKIIALTTAVSEKEDKRKANRRFRKAGKQVILAGKEDFPSMRVLSNVWGFAKDGKCYYSELSEKYMRK